MNFELFIAKRIIKGDKNSFSKPIIRISIAAIALGIAIMTLSLCIVKGFQAEIQKKISGFSSHIIISNHQSKGLVENKPISKSRPFYQEIKSWEEIKSIYPFAYKGAILKTNEDNYGIVLKGVSSDFDWDFFKTNLVEGKLPNYESSKSNEILISRHIANKLKLKIDEKVLCYFVQQPPRVRKFTIKGIYKTGLGEMDEKIVLTDLRHIQKINAWENHQVGGFELLVNNFEELGNIDNKVYKSIDYDLTATSIIDERPDIFNWLELQDINVIVIISLLVLVCGIDMISALLILLLERIQMVGILKALGSKDKSIRKIFIYNAMYLVILGTFYGNLIGLGVAWAQKQYGFLTLPQEAYFIDTVPILFNFSDLVLLNIGTLVCCFLMLLIPSKLVSKISPIKAIKFE